MNVNIQSDDRYTQAPDYKNKQTYIWIFDALVLNLVRDNDAIW